MVLKPIPPSPLSREDLARLEQQAARGHRFLHHAVSTADRRLAEVESYLYGLANLLLARGLISPEELVEAVGQVTPAIAERAWEATGLHRITLREDPPDQPAAPVDCAARLHLCRAACCRLRFALSAPEVESGKVKWDLGQPYFIRQREDGYCTHNDPASGRCTIYADRPGLCRRYSCADDKRIWKDFAQMIPNNEWLEAHLSDELEEPPIAGHQPPGR